MTMEFDLVSGFAYYWLPKTPNLKPFVESADTQNNPHQTKEWAEERVNHWWNVAISKFPPRHINRFDAPRVRFDDRMTAKNGGTAHSGKHLITLTTKYLQEDDFENTIVHEVCHIVASYHFGAACAHSARWKTVMLSTGYMPHRCHTYNLAKSALTCKCNHDNVLANVDILKKLKQGITTYRCEKCKTVLELPKSYELDGILK